MIEVKSISGDVDYVEAELQDELNDGWEVVHIQSFVYPSISSTRIQSVAYLKKETAE